MRYGELDFEVQGRFLEVMKVTSRARIQLYISTMSAELDKAENELAKSKTRFGGAFALERKIERLKGATRFLETLEP